MTPFNQTALLAMLLTFYPIVSVENLRLARSERPDYFAGGTLFGSTGEKLRLPDGRVFDLIVDASNPDPKRRRWQVIEAGGAAGDPGLFPLEPGPFVLIDEAAWPRPNPQPVFVSIVAKAFGELDTADGMLGTAASTLVEASSPAALEAVFADTIGPAEAKVESSRNTLNVADPSDVILASGGTLPTIDAHEGDYSEPAPHDIDDPGPSVDHPPGTDTDYPPIFGI